MRPVYAPLCSPASRKLSDFAPTLIRVNQNNELKDTKMLHGAEGNGRID